MPVKLKAQKKTKPGSKIFNTKHTHKYKEGDSTPQTLYMRLKHTIL